MLEFYDSEKFREAKKSYFTVPNTVWFTEYLKRKGLEMNNLKQQAGELVVYPSHIFNPLRYDDPHSSVHEESVAIHHSALSWLPWYKKCRVMIKKHLLRRYFRSEEHTSELQSRGHLVCRLLLEKKKKEEH